MEELPFWPWRRVLGGKGGGYDGPWLVCDGKEVEREAGEAASGEGVDTD